ncbi:MAG: response regulator transcription factor [Balneolaceae bacterium]|nr:response regulator transcription factor [Balneolaceae bacterium]
MERVIVSIEYLNALNKLTPRECEILEYVYRGCTSREIGEKLYLSSGTVSNHRQSICDKLNINGYRGLYKWCAINRTRKQYTLKQY